MATKSTATGEKRKSAPGGKYQTFSKLPKKPRLEEKVSKKKKPEPESDDDSEGGADLSEEAPKKSEGKTFERGMISWFNSLRN